MDREPYLKLETYRLALSTLLRRLLPKCWGHGTSQTVKLLVGNEAINLVRLNAKGEAWKTIFE